MKSVDVSEVLSCCIHLNNVFCFYSKHGINTEQIFLSLSLISLQWAAPLLTAAMKLSVTNVEISHFTRCRQMKSISQHANTMQCCQNPSTQPAAVQKTLIGGCVKSPDVIIHVFPTLYLTINEIRLPSKQQLLSSLG